LVRCGVRPSLKGAIFKALASCAKDPELVPHIWTFIEDAQARYIYIYKLVPTGSGGQGQGRGQVQGQGQGQQQDGRKGASAWGHGGLFAELDQVESRNGTYPSTEGFCCLIQQELVQHDIPYDLGERTRFSGVGGIQPYVAYLQNYVLMPDLRFADPGERWRVVARVLQTMLTLLRRYPLTRSGGSHLSMATAEDEESCRMDFDPKASSQVTTMRYKSPGYYILRQILGQGGVFRQMVQVLRGKGGVGGLKAERAEAATTNALK
ncbi:unnamed protein product, partial [Laminaria digitata]